MSTILQGRRAKKYIGLAKSMLAGMKLRGVTTASATQKVPAGLVLVQKNGELDRMLIKVRDPCIATLLRLRRTDGSAHYTHFFSGLTGEAALPDVLFNNQGVSMSVGIAALHNVGNGSAISTTVAGGFIGGDTVDDGAGHTTTALLRMVTMFSVANWQRGVNTILLAQYELGVTLRAESLVSFTSIGESAAGSAVVVASASTETAPGTRYDVLLRMTAPETLALPETIWPPSGLNGGRPDLARIFSIVGCHGRGKMIFGQSYVKDWRDPAAPVPRLPDIIRLTDFGATQQITPILTAMPSLNTYLDAGELPVALGSAFAYSGGNNITAMINLDSATELFTSADGGDSWTARGWPAGAGELLNVPDFVTQSIYSMYAGHVEFVTFKSSTNEYTLYTSTDHGASWSAHVLLMGEGTGRYPKFAVPLGFDGAGVPTRHARFSQRERDVYSITVYNGVSLNDQMYEVPFPRADYENRAGDSSPAFPTLCLIGAPHQPAPIMLGHPGVLEFPS